MITHKELSDEKAEILERLLFRIKAVRNAKDRKYILLNTRNENIGKISEILPGLESPTIIPLSEEGWSTLHTVVYEDTFWEIIDRLKDAGAEGILVVSIDKLID